jgi:hypothetical protein
VGRSEVKGEEHMNREQAMADIVIIARNAIGKILELQKREWVGLTDEEIKEIIGPWGDTPIKGYTRKLFDQIEAKLRSKNDQA